MEVIITPQTFISIAGLITAVGVIIGAISKLIKKLNSISSYDEKIAEVKTEVNGLKNEQYMQTKVLLATLDGLRQLGCNGKVTEATNELMEFMNDQAHHKEA